MWKSIVAVAGVVTVASIAGSVNHAQQPARKVDFATEVLPIFRQNCFTCHGPKEQKNGFRLDRRKDAMRGGTIAMIGPGNADGSRLYQKLISAHFGPQMPPTWGVALHHRLRRSRPGSTREPSGRMRCPGTLPIRHRPILPRWR